MALRRDPSGEIVFRLVCCHGLKERERRFCRIVWCSRGVHERFTRKIILVAKDEEDATGQSIMRIVGYL